LHQVPTTPSPRSPLCPPLRISTYHDIELGETAIFTDDTAIQLHRQRTRNRDASSAPNRPEGCLRSSWRIQDPILHHHPTQTSPITSADINVPSPTAATWTTRENGNENKSKSRIRIHPPLVAPLCMHKDDSLLLLPKSSRDGCKCVSYATIHTSTHPPPRILRRHPFPTHTYRPLYQPDSLSDPPIPHSRTQRPLQYSASSSYRVPHPRVTHKPAPIPDYGYLIVSRATLGRPFGPPRQRGSLYDVQELKGPPGYFVHITPIVSVSALKNYFI
jgi:hypothetical protein